MHYFSLLLIYFLFHQSFGGWGWGGVGWRVAWAMEEFEHQTWPRQPFKSNRSAWGLLHMAPGVKGQICLSLPRDSAPWQGGEAELLPPAQSHPGDNTFMPWKCRAGSPWQKQLERQFAMPVLIVSLPPLIWNQTLCYLFIILSAFSTSRNAGAKTLAHICC